MIKSVLFTICVLINFQVMTDKANRKKMVDEQIIARGIDNAQTIQAMLKVPRHEFVPNEYRHLAYADNPLPIGYSQTISQPYIVAYMTSVLDLQGTDTVLEIGTGSGYQAAVLAEIVNHVYTIEIVEPLAKQANKTIKRLNYKNVTVKTGDGYHGIPDKAPFDAIIVTAGAKSIPEPLLNQLSNNGKMIIPVGKEGQIQHLKIVEKKDGKIKTQKLLPVRFVPFTRNN